MKEEGERRGKEKMNMYTEVGEGEVKKRICMYICIYKILR
jgi:hypothetical protein